MKLKMPNGDIVPVPEGMTPEDTIDQWNDQVLQEKGVDPHMKMKSDKDVEYEAGKAWDADSKNNSRGASFAAGAAKLGRNVANMVLPQAMQEKYGFTDQDLADKDAIEKPLTEDQPVSNIAGSIAPTMLLPGGAGLSLTRAALEGAAYGGAMAGPGDRAKGAAWGAGGGTVGRVLQRSLGRLVQGLGKQSPEAERVVQRQGWVPGGETPELPVGMAAPTSGPGAAARYAYEKVLTNFPNASRKLDAQANEVVQTTYRNMLRQAFGKHADDAIHELEESGRLDNAIKVGKSLMTKDPVIGTGKYIAVLDNAAAKARGGNPTMQRIGATSGRMFPEKAGDAPLRAMADDLDTLISKRVAGEGNLDQRHWIYKILRLDPVFVGTVTRTMASKGFQRFVMGNAQWQKAMQKAMNEGDGPQYKLLMERAIREYGEEEGIQEGSNIKQRVADYMGKAK